VALRDAAGRPPPASSTRTADPEDLTVCASDGVRLAARLFVPRRAACAAAVVAPAMAVAQRYYEPFARWLAAQDVLALTFDPRGIGRSRRGHLRDERADVLTWAERDFGAALRALADRAGPLPITWIGHSLGGQVLPFVPGRERIANMVTVACGTGYWRESVIPRRAWVLWRVIAPACLSAFGWFPGRRLGLVGDLPGPAMAQWRRWCLHPDYAMGAERAGALYAAVRTPITAISFTDDELMSARNFEALDLQYANAPRRRIRVAPADVGFRRVGHFGFFRPGSEPLWRELILPELPRSQNTGSSR
jgi:predicted alpha/beta hydrolase